MDDPIVFPDEVGLPRFARLLRRRRAALVE